MAPGVTRLRWQVLLLGQGQPEAVAGWLATAMALALAPQELAGRALCCAPAPWQLLPCGAGLGEDSARHSAAAVELPIAVEYRYRLALGAAGGGWLECWRRYGHGIGWQRRCGPMALEEFIRHRLHGVGTGCRPLHGGVRPGASPPGPAGSWRC
jgi:hypothetical protein